MSDVPVRLSVIVDRSRWLRGEGEDRSRLLRPEDGRMCCLGFACLAAGHTPDEIMDVATPSGIPVAHEDVRSLLPTDDMSLYGLAMGVNDEIGLADEHREKSLITLLAGTGIDISFVDAVGSS